MTNEAISGSDPAYLVVVQEHDVGPQPHPGDVGLAVGGGRGVKARGLTVTRRQPPGTGVGVTRLTIITPGVRHGHGAEVKQAVCPGYGHRCH